MKISFNFKKMAQRAQTLAIAFGLALVACAGANAAYAAPKKAEPVTGEFKIDPVVQAKSMTDIPAIIAVAKINCDPVDAYLMGGTEFTKDDGTKVKGQLYEVACKTGPGFIITSVSPTETGQAFTCSLAAKLQLTRPESILCVLPENKPHYAWLNAVVQPYIPGCQISNARVIGSTSVEPMIDRYEVGCNGQAGGVLDYAQLGHTAPTEFKGCLAVADSKSACEFTTQDQLITQLKPVAAQADASCQVNNIRWIGITSENNGTYYEFGCANKAGFVVLTKMDNTYVRTISCAAAAGLGGCKFTDAGTASKEAGGAYADILAKGGYPCTIQQFNLIGTQEETKRDYIEFKCPEQPWGLIGLIPRADSTSRLRVSDCFVDQTNRKLCTFVTEPQLRAQLDKLIKVARPDKGCDIANVRYIGEAADIEGGVIVEIACGNKRGYIATVAADRKTFANVASCQVAKASKDEILCELPGNGTNAASE